MFQDRDGSVGQAVNSLHYGIQGRHVISAVDVFLVVKEDPSGAGGRDDSPHSKSGSNGRGFEAILPPFLDPDCHL